MWVSIFTLKIDVDHRTATTLHSAMLDHNNALRGSYPLPPRTWAPTLNNQFLFSYIALRNNSLYIVRVLNSVMFFSSFFYHLFLMSSSTLKYHFRSQIGQTFINDLSDKAFHRSKWLSDGKSHSRIQPNTSSCEANAPRVIMYISLDRSIDVARLSFFTLFHP